MDLTAVGQLIANIGFPCACVVALFVMWQKETERHREEMQDITRALNDNTLVMQRLLDKLEGEEKT